MPIGTVLESSGLFSELECHQHLVYMPLCRHVHWHSMRNIIGQSLRWTVYERVRSFTARYHGTIGMVSVGARASVVYAFVQHNSPEPSVDSVSGFNSIGDQRTVSFCSLVNPCSTAICRNGGLCSPVFNASSASFTCTCRSSFTGQFCETPLFALALSVCSSTCPNNGSCVNGACVCTSQNIGPLCQYSTSKERKVSGTDERHCFFLCQPIHARHETHV